MKCPLSALADAAGALETRGPLGADVTGLAYDSRHVKPGFLFLALGGLHVDGHDYVRAAVRAGAVAVVHERPLDEYADGVAYFRVQDSRAAMSPIAAAFWGRPSSRMAVIGVTGTEGKSTTVWLIYRLLSLLGKKAGFMSTVEYCTGGAVMPNPEHQTTPEATTVHERLAAMAESGVEYAVVESSSHGLSRRYNRLGDVDFDVGLMTNVRHEHLEFHGTWECYRDDKANLFRALDAHGHAKSVGGDRVVVPSFGAVCLDDPSAAFFADATNQAVYTYSARNDRATMYATDIEADERGASFVVRDDDSIFPARIELPGLFNVENVLGALLVVSRLLDMDSSDIAPFLPLLEPVKGRMTRVDRGQPFELLVDYAHTPSSFEAVLPPVKARIAGRLICLFGSAGERDVQKRPAQGRIASACSDIVILADEDPRGEDPMALLEDIAAGCEGKTRGEDLFLIPDRAQAIRKAVSLARAGDAVLLLGKGHENTIIYAKGTIPWDELGEAAKALGEAGFTA